MEKITYFEALKKLKTHREWLDYYKLFFPIFWVQPEARKIQSGEFIFCKWEIYNEKLQEKNYCHRQIFPIEVVFDWDCSKSLERAEWYAEIIKKKLIDEGYNFSIWYSGGVGIHMHIFLPELNDYSIEERKYIKKHFLKKFDFDSGYIDYTVIHPKRLISTECSKHRKGGIKKLKEIIKINDELNYIPKRVIENAFSEMEEENSMAFVDDENVKDKTNMNCIKFIEDGRVRKELKDFRRRLSFLYSSYMIHKHSPTYIINKLMNYMGSSQKEIEQIVKYVSKDRNMSCRGRRVILKEINKDSLCENCECNLTEKKEK